MPAASFSSGIESGQMLTFVVHIDGTPHSEQVTVLDVEPFVVEAHASWCRLLRRGMRVVLLRPFEGHFAKAEVELVSINKFRNTYRVGFESPSWLATDRRKFPRFEVETALEIRQITESLDGIRFESARAMTEDLSAGGAWVVSELEPVAGTVVQVELNLNGHLCRVLGVVVRNEPNRKGFAIEFLDFIGSSRYVLNEFLRLAA